jgi:nitrate/TMAO reductase-like tetraheme cytochrome c subunit
VPCATCHTAGYDGTPTACYSCHRTDYDSADTPDHEGFPTTCESCHSTSAWQPASFNHAATSFPLTGAHTSVPCASCHAAGYDGTPTACYSCHRSDYEGADDPDHADFPTTCQNCHTTTGWEPATFNHSATDFPLTGAHTSVACAECHASGYDGTPTDCYACHASDYNGTTDPNHAAAGFPTTCLNCHNTTSWEGATFDHDGQYFPIYSGTHRNEWSTCSQCHNVPGNYAIFSCLTCHEHRQSEMDSKHQDVGGYSYSSPACLSCHPDGTADD